MDNFKHTRFSSICNSVGTLQRRRASVSVTTKKHIEYWEQVSELCKVDFTVESDPYIRGTGKILGKEFFVESELVANGEDVLSEIRVTTVDALSGRTVLVDSYFLDAHRRVLCSLSREPLKHPDTEDHDMIEYHVICELLYSVATRSSVQSHRPDPHQSSTHPD